MQILSDTTLNSLDKYAQAFQSNQPFKHVLMKDFFDNDFCRKIVDNFPKIKNPEALINEFGDKSRKAARHDVRNLGSVYVALDNYVKSPEFLEIMSRLSGIPNLIYDPEYHGAGTHENLNGQGMDTHIDFNYHRTTGLHRRLNAIIYLNEQWEAEWGGSIDLHKNPWNPDEDWHVSFLPLLNNCVLFETNEYSWHGFSPVQVPPGKKVISRKSFTIYFYSQERPTNEIAEKHGTIYIQSPLPAHIKPGYVIADSDLTALKSNFKKRNNYLAAMYRREKQFHTSIQNLKGRLDKFEKLFSVPVYGYAVCKNPVTGIYPDMSASGKVSLPLFTKKPLTTITVRGLVPDFIGTNKLSFAVDGLPILKDVEVKGRFSVDIPWKSSSQKNLTLTITSAKNIAISDNGISKDKRKIAFKLIEVECHHGAETVAKKTSNLPVLSEPQFRNCPVCNSVEAKLVGELPVTQRIPGRQSYSLVNCKNCDLVYIDPLPSQKIFAAMYHTENLFASKSYNNEKADAAIRFMSNRLKKILDFQKTAAKDKIRVLEVGAGLSWMCHVAKQLNPESITVAQDLTTQAVEQCTWVDDYQVGYLEDLHDAILSQGPFDVISMTHVIEHLPNPLPIIKHCRKFIAPQGIFFITAPHRPVGWNSGSDIKLWQNWHLSHVPGHIQYYNKTSMEQLAQLSDFEIAYHRQDLNNGDGMETWLRAV